LPHTYYEVLQQYDGAVHAQPSIADVVKTDPPVTIAPETTVVDTTISVDTTIDPTGITVPVETTVLP
jgi:hypothetical protein